MRISLLCLALFITLIYSSYNLQAAAAAETPPRIYARTLMGAEIPLDLKNVKESATPVQWMKEQIAKAYGYDGKPEKVNIKYKGIVLTDAVARTLMPDARIFISLNS